MHVVGLFIVANFVSSVINFVVSMISSSGYLGIFVLMCANAAAVPFPSEVIMPFAGYLVSTGKLSFTYVIITGSCGNLLGAIFLYYLSRRLGRQIILKYGRYILLKEKHLQTSEKFFKKYGNISVLIARMLPVVGGLISIPAGLAMMNMRKFIVYTFCGYMIWNASLTYIGMKLGENWHKLPSYQNYLYLLSAVILILIIIYFKKKGKLPGK